MANQVWNPNSAVLVGEEWLVDYFGTWDLVLAGPWAQRIRSRAAETINALKWWQMSSLAPVPYAPYPIGPASAGGVDCVLAEIIAAGSEIPTGVVTTATYQPSADQAINVGSISNSWSKNPGGAITNLFQAIDEGVDTPGTDYVQLAQVTTGASYDIRFGSSGFSATARVLGIKIRMIAHGPKEDITVTARHTSGVEFIPAGGKNIVLPRLGDPNVVFTYDLGEINPVTGLPWTPADIQSWSSGTWFLRLYGPGAFHASGTILELDAIEMVVTYQTVENRAAAAMWKNAIGVTQAAGVMVSNAFCALPGAGSSWAKPAAGDFTVLLRRPYAPLLGYFPHNPSLLWIAARTAAGVETACPVPGVVSASPTVDQYGQVTAIDFTGAVKNRAIGLLVMTSAPAVSTDSLPYVTGDAYAHSVAASGVLQRFTPAASWTYDNLKILVKPGVATLPMTLKIKRTSDNVQFGATQTVTPATVAALPDESNGWKLLTFSGMGAALVAGTQYFLELTSADTAPQPTGWIILVLGDALMPGDAATFGGATDVLNLPGFGLQPSSDIAFTLGSLVPAMAGLTATVATIVPSSFAGSSLCGVATFQVARLAWTASVLGATWTRYEIQRTEDLGVTWSTIAYGQTFESVVTFDDYEAPRALAVQYRIRVVRSDGSTSAWTAATPSVTCQPAGCEMAFVTNEQPSFAASYNREPEISFAFLAAGRDQIQQLYGVDGAIAFMETEDPLEAFDVTLTINFKDTPPQDDRTIWSKIRRIGRAATSYVCVLDFTGSRWFAHLQVPQGDWSEPGFEYHAQVHVTEMTATPSIAVF